MLPSIKTTQQQQQQQQQQSAPQHTPSVHQCIHHCVYIGCNHRPSNAPRAWLCQWLILAVLLAPLNLLAALFAESVDRHRQNALRLLGLGVMPERERVLVLRRPLLHVPTLCAHAEGRRHARARRESSAWLIVPSQMSCWESVWTT